MTEQVPEIPISKFKQLNPFDEGDGGEEKGNVLAPDSLAGGGRAFVGTHKSELNVSRAIKKRLVQLGEIGEADAKIDSDESSPALRELLGQPYFVVPEYILDRSYPLSAYLVSSSHNTYLVANQLYGGAAANTYRDVLRRGARCVEIDAWDNEQSPDEPKVTHGYTLTQHIPFREVCQAIGDALDSEIASAKERGLDAPPPLLLSLENHCSWPGQRRLVDIMKETWGDKLVSDQIQSETGKEQGTDREITMDEMAGRIVVMVEYYSSDGPENQHEGDSSDSDSDDEEVKEHRAKKRAAKNTKICPELSQLGVYAQSVKPEDDAWLKGELRHPPNHLINVSEDAVKELLPKSRDLVAKHNAKHLMRVYPHGLRVTSHNLNPVPFWGVGAQVSALNWQTFDASMQINEALFTGTEGYVLKPPSLRQDGLGNRPSGKVRLELEVFGASDLPVPAGRTEDEIRPYVTCTLLHPDETGKPPKRKTSAWKAHKHKDEGAKPLDPVWNETLSWEYEDHELVFLRILIKDDVKMARNVMFAVTAVRVLYLTEGWRFLRLLDLSGRETQSTLLVRFKVTKT